MKANWLNLTMGGCLGGLLMACLLWVTEYRNPQCLKAVSIAERAGHTKIEGVYVKWHQRSYCLDLFDEYGYGVKSFQMDGGSNMYMDLKKVETNVSD